MDLKGLPTHLRTNTIIFNNIIIKGIFGQVQDHADDGKDVKHAGSQQISYGDAFVPMKIQNQNKNDESDNKVYHTFGIPQKERPGQGLWERVFQKNRFAERLSWC